MGLYTNESNWEDSAPVELHTAIKHLRDLFGEGHRTYGKTTRVYCYCLLHNGENSQEISEEYGEALLNLSRKVGTAWMRKFHKLVIEKTPSHIFRAYFDLYLDAMTRQAMEYFQQLVQMGLAKQPLLKEPCLEWAESQTKHVVRSKRSTIRRWVRDVCDKKPPSEPGDGPDEMFFWRSWRAPKFLMMNPALTLPFEGEKVLDRLDAELTGTVLTLFEDMYVMHLEMAVKHLAGTVAVAVAKRPMDIHDSTGSQSAGATVTTAEVRPKPSTGRREARKLKTQARNEQWQKEYRALRRKHPEKSKVWCSLQIAKLPIANGRDASTIKKHMLR